MQSNFSLPVIITLHNCISLEMLSQYKVQNWNTFKREWTVWRVLTCSLLTHLLKDLVVVRPFVWANRGRADEIDSKVSAWWCVLLSPSRTYRVWQLPTAFTTTPPHQITSVYLFLSENQFPIIPSLRTGNEITTEVYTSFQTIFSVGLDVLTSFWTIRFFRFC